jgi:hypothetical protein
VGSPGARGSKGDTGSIQTASRADICRLVRRLNVSPFNAAMVVPPYCTDLTFQATGAYQTMTVLATGNYRIEVSGAQGGAESPAYHPAPQLPTAGQGGLGARVSGIVPLVAGDVLCVIVGMRPNGPVSAFDAGAGGGGSFVFLSDGTCSSMPPQPLLVAGGGAGGKGGSGRTQQSGGSGALPGGINGNGGQAFTANAYHSGAGGTGWISAGQNGSAESFAGGGGHWAGGAGANWSGFLSSAGGFGGGGGAGLVCNAGCGSGGGGGYGGGAGGAQITESNGGGGGSFVSGTGTTTAGGVQAGHGVVRITLQ